MKKTYQQPNTTIVFVMTQQMIAASADNLLNGFNTGDAGSLDGNITGGNLGRRNYSVWGDDDDYLF